MKQVAFDVDEALWVRMKVQAAQDGVRLSETVGKALRWYLEQRSWTAPPGEDPSKEQPAPQGTKDNPARSAAATEDK